MDAEQMEIEKRDERQSTEKGIVISKANLPD